MVHLSFSGKPYWANVAKMIVAWSFSSVLLLASPLLAQLNYGRIFGGVTDATGGAIANATVTMISLL